MSELRPPFPYFGGKQRIADRIIGLFPIHRHYVEPYAGGLSVLLAKPPAPVETINDLDRALCTFWRVLRDRPDDLIRVCVLTPHSRAELQASYQQDAGLDEVEVARRVWVQLSQGRAGIRRHNGWRFTLDGETKTPLSAYLTAYLDRMPAAAARLATVQLECREALDVIGDHAGRADTLLYVDPPYPSAVRTGGRYRHEMSSDAAHQELADLLHSCRGPVVVSGYRCELYERLYRGWTPHEFKAYTSQAGRGSIGDRIEVCWTNFEPAPHLFSDDNDAAHSLDGAGAR